jgi:hypothetical protein
MIEEMVDSKCESIRKKNTKSILNHIFYENRFILFKLNLFLTINIFENFINDFEIKVLELTHAE